MDKMLDHTQVRPGSFEVIDVPLEGRECFQEYRYALVKAVVNEGSRRLRGFWPGVDLLRV